MTLHVRPISDDEQKKIERLTHAQTVPVRLARRARIIALAATGLSVPAIAVQVQQSAKCVRRWIERFNAAGLDGLDDAPRSGRPRTYPEDVYSHVIAKARGLPPKPAEGAVPPTCHWTLDRLQTALAKEGLPIKRSQIRRILKTEHLTWQKPRTWLESTDPDFAEKRGSSSGSIRLRHQTVPCSASTNSAPAQRGTMRVPVGATTRSARISVPTTRAMAIAGRLARSCIGPARSL
jgi:transposase